jgi:hypothetical protein
MASIKETLQVNAQGALLGVEEGGFSFANQFNNIPRWKRLLILAVAVLIIPGYIGARVGTEQYLNQKYAREALAAHPAFSTALDPVVGKMTIIRNPNNSYSGVVLITNPNIDLAATDIDYTVSFLNSNKQPVYTSTGTTYLLPNEKKYIVVPKVEGTSSGVASGSLSLAEVKWQKKLDIPEVKLRATEPISKEEVNPLMFVAEGSIINDSPYQIGSARIVFLLYNDANEIIGVSQRDEFRLLPFGRRAYKQLWPGLYASQVKKVQVIPTTNSLDPQNITIDTAPTAPANVNSNTNNDFF